MSKLVQFLSDAGSISTVVPTITRQTFVIARTFIKIQKKNNIPEFKLGCDECICLAGARK